MYLRALWTSAQHFPSFAARFHTRSCTQLVSKLKSNPINFICKRNFARAMSGSEVVSLDALIAQRVAAGEKVRQLKESKADAALVSAAVAELQALKEQVDKLTIAQKSAEADERKKLAQFRSDVEDLCRRRFIFIASFEIYGGVGGLYDYGPVGCTLKENFLALWRRHFVLEEDMQEISTVCMTPEPVLKASGHVDRFTDLMVRDEKTSDCFRADKLLEAHIDKLLEDVTVPSATRADYAIVRNNAGNYNAVEMKAAFERFQIVSPDTGNSLCDPFPYNLMFASSIGPTGKVPGFLRPETAQGIFTNFRRLLEANNNRMPFAAAQIGLAFRNEIAPRSGLLRVREFQMAEIEHFVNPNDKQHPRFQEVADVELNLFSRDLQGGAEENTIHMTIGDAVAKGIIDNQTLGYYLARTHLFLIKVGINPAKLRFRQHKSNEMAHYAKDCWDAEIHTSYGWVECVGHADRACYDLVQHAKASNVELCAHESFAEPRIEEVARFNFNRGAIAKQFRKDQQRICDHLQALPKADALAVKAELESAGTHTINFCTGESFTVTAEQVKIAIVQEKISSRKYVPSVIEPSFGIGRILYALIEHAFWTRPDDVQKKVLAFSPFIAPTKCSVFPLSGNPEFAPYTRQVSRLLLDAGISSRVDESGSSLGRRYARTDEIGVPFALTVDFQTAQDKTVTVRERDSTKQIRLPMAEAPAVIGALCNGTASWTDMQAKYPSFTEQVVAE